MNFEISNSVIHSLILFKTLSNAFKLISCDFLISSISSFVFTFLKLETTDSIPLIFFTHNFSSLSILHKVVLAESTFNSFIFENKALILSLSSTSTISYLSNFLLISSRIKLFAKIENTLFLIRISILWLSCNQRRYLISDDLEIR
ncbi:TPA: hypothetical protein DEG21_01960 [Patescibacteria group bacterium]|nr:hypothetical protein [Candidatus Gracilibacteria bacterium]HBY74650.1 hypothetical protein [Candidatus Gracilibacteria bacterium]